MWLQTLFRVIAGFGFGVLCVLVLQNWRVRRDKLRVKKSEGLAEARIKELAAAEEFKELYGRFPQEATPAFVEARIKNCRRRIMIAQMRRDRREHEEYLALEKRYLNAANIFGLSPGNISSENKARKTA